MNCQYSKYVDNLISGNLDDDKSNELIKHSSQCAECAERLEIIGQVDNLMRDVLIEYPFISSKAEIMKKIESKKKRTSFFAKLHSFRKPIYSAALILIFVFSYNYMKPTLNEVILKGQSIAKEKEDIKRLGELITSENIIGVSMPGEDYERYIIRLPGIIRTGDPESEARSKEILEQTKRDEISHINEWVSFINSYTTIRKASQNEINSIGYKKSNTPLTLILKDGAFIHLYPVIEKVEVKDTIQGKLTIKTPYMDRYIIGYREKGASDKDIIYYTIFSKSPLVYGTNRIKEDIYRHYTINKIDSEGKVSKEFPHSGTDLLKNGDKLVISGISYGDEVYDVYIKNGSNLLNTPDPVKDSPSAEIYAIANIHSIMGEWSLEKNFSYNMKTYDGKEFTLGNKMYYYEIDYKNSSGQRLSANGGRLADLSK